VLGTPASSAVLPNRESSLRRSLRRGKKFWCGVRIEWERSQPQRSNFREALPDSTQDSFTTDMGIKGSKRDRPPKYSALKEYDVLDVENDVLDVEKTKPLPKQEAAFMEMCKIFMEMEPRDFAAVCTESHSMKITFQELSLLVYGRKMKWESIYSYVLILKHSDSPGRPLHKDEVELYLSSQ
jgi:hypothetical protein